MKNEEIECPNYKEDLIRESLSNLEDIIHDDDEYAWVWQCNLAMASYDEGLDLAASNRAAARFMKILFNIDMTEHERFEATQKEEYE